MKILVVGGGGREHAIINKLSQNKDVEKIYCAPGNGGIANLAECVNMLLSKSPTMASPFSLNQTLV